MIDRRNGERVAWQPLLAEMVRAEGVRKRAPERRLAAAADAHDYQRVSHRFIDESGGGIVMKPSDLGPITGCLDRQ
jgi:hypothetical protein